MKKTNCQILSNFYLLCALTAVLGAAGIFFQGPGRTAVSSFFLFSRAAEARPGPETVFFDVGEAPPRGSLMTQNFFNDQPDFAAASESKEPQGREVSRLTDGIDFFKSPAPSNDYPPGVLQECRDDNMGVKILCDPRWEIEVDEEGTLIIISKEPAVLLAIVKLDSRIRTIEQLNHDFFLALEQYAEGFRTEHVLFGSDRAVKVKAFSRSYPDIRLVDFYLIHEGRLYGLLFSVDPKNEWEKFQFLIQELVQSFEFI